MIRARRCTVYRRCSWAFVVATRALAPPPSRSTRRGRRCSTRREVPLQPPTAPCAPASPPPSRSTQAGRLQADSTADVLARPGPGAHRTLREECFLHHGQVGFLTFYAASTLLTSGN